MIKIGSHAYYDKQQNQHMILISSSCTTELRIYYILTLTRYSKLVNFMICKHDEHKNKISCSTALATGQYTNKHSSTRWQR